MTSGRKLTLKRETIAELTADDLRRIVGAEPAHSGPTCPVRDCVDRLSLSNCCTPHTGVGWE